MKRLERLTIAGIAAAISCAAGSGTARADQCAWLDNPAIAARAAEELSGRTKMIHFCEPCGEEAPGSPLDIADVTVRPAGDRHSEVAVGGLGIDLAYIYVQTSELEYHNLALLAGCPARDVSPSLRVDRATPTGVLIRAQRTSPSPASPPVRLEEARLSPPPDTRPGWLAAFFAGAATVVATSMLIGARAALARRRRASLPRAVRLLEDRTGGLHPPRTDLGRRATAATFSAESGASADETGS